MNIKYVHFYPPKVIKHNSTDLISVNTTSIYNIWSVTTKWLTRMSWGIGNKLMIFSLNIKGVVVNNSGSKTNFIEMIILCKFINFWKIKTSVMKNRERIWTTPFKESCTDSSATHPSGVWMCQFQNQGGDTFLLRPLN